MAMSPCWACSGAPPSWFSICEECGGTGVCSTTPVQAEMQRVERHYWRGSMGQYSNPFRSRQPELGFIVPPNPNPLLLRV
jgi:hypothetical protein